MKKALLIILILHLSSICLFAQEKLNADKSDALKRKNLEIIFYRGFWPYSL